MQHIFPQDFKKKPHEVVPGAMQWTLEKDGEITISVVGGGFGIYGNGKTTFEMYDFREDGPQGWLTKEEINIHLINHPL